MSNRVKSNNVIIQMLISGTYYPVFCGKSMEFVQNQETIEVTSINSAVSREYEAGMTTGSLSINGVTILDNTGSRVAITYLMTEAIRRTPQTMRIVLTDDDGGMLQIAFSALITSNRLSRQFGTYSLSNSDFVVTGDITISALVPPPGGSCIEIPLYLATTPGATSVSDSALEATGVVILQVDREGLQHDETTGTPGNREFKFTGGAGAGTVAFDPTNPFNSGETVYVLYKII